MWRKSDDMPHRHPAAQCIAMLFYHGSNKSVIVGVIRFSGFMDRPIFILEPNATQCQIADDKAYLTRFQCGDTCDCMWEACARQRRWWWWVFWCRKCKVKHKVREQDVMDMKLGCQQNWVERILNPNQILARVRGEADLWLCIKELAAANRHPVTFG